MAAGGLGLVPTGRRCRTAVVSVIVAAVLVAPYADSRPPASTAGAASAAAGQGWPSWPEPALPLGGESAIPPAPPAFEGAPPPPARSPAVLDAPAAAASGTWAVVIGINDYPRQRYDLRAAAADADGMAAALRVLGVPAERVLVLRDGQATSTAIRRAIVWLTARAAPDAVAAFFYAGHVRKVDRGRDAIVGSDGVPLTDDDLARAFAPLAARRAWFAFAACYGAGFTELLQPGRVLTGAAGADELAYENSAYGRSYLVEYMVRRAMIQGNAPTSVQAAFAYAQRELARDHPNRQPVQIDHAGAPVDLRPPPPQRATTRSADGPSDDDRSPPPESQPPPPSSPPSRRDRCAELTASIVRCSP